MGSYGEFGQREWEAENPLSADQIRRKRAANFLAASGSNPQPEPPLTVEDLFGENVVDETNHEQSPD